MTPEHNKLVKEWSVRLMRRLYDERPRFCDVAIECIPGRRPEDGKDDAPVQNVVYAHRAVLAARTQYVLRLLSLCLCVCVPVLRCAVGHGSWLAACWVVRLQPVS
jgi:hypothetical protein